MPEVHRTNEAMNTYRNAATVVPNDVTELATWCKAIYVGGTGNIVLVTAEGNTVTFNAVPVGTTLQISAKIIKATSTTATLMLAMW